MLRRLNSEKSVDTQYQYQYQYHHVEAIKRCKSGLGLGPDPYSYNSRMFGGVEESEVVDELLQILVECMKKADIRGQEILLRKFFFEIEKELPLQRFLVERLKQSKISSLIPTCTLDERILFPSDSEISTREINACDHCGGGTTTSSETKLDRFKIRTVQIGVDVKEETETSS